MRGHASSLILRAMKEWSQRREREEMRASEDVMRCEQDRGGRNRDSAQ